MGASLIIPMLVGLATSGASAYMQYSAGKQQAEAQEDITKYNAEIARQNIDAKRNQNDINVARSREANRRRLSAINAKQSASGLAMAGTALDMQAKEAGTLEAESLDLFEKGNMALSEMERARSAGLYSGSLMAQNTRSQANAGAFGTAMVGIMSATSLFADKYQPTKRPPKAIQVAEV